MIGSIIGYYYGRSNAMKQDSGLRGSALVAAIEADLLAGVCRPGEWLKQADVEERYGANRFDVRMALLELKARHLISHVRNRGYRVVNPSEREREELVQLRCILETAAIRMVAAKITRTEIAGLRGIVDEFSRHMEEGDLDRLRALNHLFHDRLYQACGNDMLVAEIKAMRLRGLPGGGSAWKQISGIRRSDHDHRQILRLLTKRDADALERLTVDHLNRWREAGGPTK